MTRSEATKKFLVISAVGEDRAGIVNAFSRAVLDYQCNIEDSRMTVLGGEFALILLISGKWNAVAKLEAAMPELERKLKLTLIVKHTQARERAANLMPYVVDVVALDHPGIVHEVAQFFSSREINIEELSTSAYAAAHTGTPMFALTMTVSVPAHLHIGQLRNEFTDFCDQLNLDATLEPARH